MKGSLCRLAETSFLWRDTAMRIRERFNPRAPCGARRRFHPLPPPRHIHYFNPRAPCGARPGNVGRGAGDQADFNPRAPCGARRSAPQGLITRQISTHAPLAGRDCDLPENVINDQYFNPRAPCGARRYARRNGACEKMISTHAPLAGRDV